MDRRDEIINSMKSEQDKTLAARIIDAAAEVQKFYSPVFTDFLDPAQTYKAGRILSRFQDMEFIAMPGTEKCERNIMAVYPDYMIPSDIHPPIEALRVTGNFKFENITHRDMLGAIMSLGIKREKTGDIILDGSEFYIYVSSDISYYIMVNLTKIKHASINCERVELCSVPEKADKYKIIKANVASLRLDSICSVGFGCSRTAISENIKTGGAKVNWEEERDLSRIVDPGDVISIKGKGRVILDSAGNETKKGRINITLKKII